MTSAIDLLRPDDPALGPTSFVVGCVNFEAVYRDKEATLAKMLGFVRQASDDGVELLIFPELALNSWGNCLECADRHAPCDWHLGEAELATGPASEAIAAVAASHNLHVIYGYEERDPVNPSIIYNSANLVGPDGLIGTYRKLHLGIPLETDRFTPGDALPVFDTALGPIGISICYDFYNNPELSRVLCLKGARLLVNPTGRSDLPRARENLEQATLIRAQENLVFAASANRVGSSHGPPGSTSTWAGGSVIAGPKSPGFSIVHAQAGEAEELISARIDFTDYSQWCDWLPWRQWRTGPQAPITKLVADELAALAEPSPS